MLIVAVVFAIIITSVVFVQFVGFQPLDTNGTPVPPPPEPDPDPDPPPVPPPIPVPDIPILNVIASPSNTGDIYITWNSVSDANRYAIYRSDDGTSYDLLEEIYATYYGDLIVEDGTYYYKIKAEREGVYSDYSETQSVVVCLLVIIEPPVKPVLESILPETSDNGLISLSWNSISNALYYEVYRSYNRSSFELIKTLDKNYYEDLVLDNGVYSYKIIAGNDGGISGYSNMQYTVVYITEPIEPINDYTILYIVIVVLGVAVVPVVILTRKKKK